MNQRKTYDSMTIVGSGRLGVRRRLLTLQSVIHWITSIFITGWISHTASQMGRLVPLGTLLA